VIIPKSPRNSTPTISSAAAFTIPSQPKATTRSASSSNRPSTSPRPPNYFSPLTSRLPHRRPPRLRRRPTQKPREKCYRRIAISDAHRASERERVVNQVSEYILGRQQRDEISVDNLAMLILRILQRNRGVRTVGGGPYVSYYHTSLAAILEIEIFNRDQTFNGVESSFKHKLAFGFCHGPQMPAMPRTLRPLAVNLYFGRGSGAAFFHSKNEPAGTMQRWCRRSLQNGAVSQNQNAH
jgi:hypothetical protein